MMYSAGSYRLLTSTQNGEASLSEEQQMTESVEGEGEGDVYQRQIAMSDVAARVKMEIIMEMRCCSSRCEVGEVGTLGPEWQ